MVLKPAVGLDGHGVRRVRSGEVPSLGAGGPWLVQPWLTEVTTDGELSVVVVEGRPTHAVLRRPPPHDFRAQERLGGTVAPVELSDEIAAFGRAAPDWIDPVQLYARVDLVRAEGGLVLSELELVEPSLFLAFALEALAEFEAAVRGRLLG